MLKKCCPYIMPLLPLLPLWFAACTNKGGVESVDVAPDLNAPVVEYMQANADAHAEKGYAWDDARAEAAEMIGTFYANREYRPFWTSDQKPGKNAVLMDSLLHEARDYGLDTTFYRLAEITAMSNRIAASEGDEKIENIANYEYLLTNETLRFMSHLNQGVLDKDSFFVEEKLDKVNKDILALLQEGASSGKLMKYVLDAQPDFYEYHQLQRGLAGYLDAYDVSESDEEFYIHNGKKDSVKAMEDARKALVSYGFLAEADKDNNEKLIAALKNYQRFHGLNEDAKVGRNTRAMLKLNNHDRYMQAVVSLQRLRWEADTSNHYVYVNIPNYHLKVVKHNEVKKQFRVVVGTPYNKTPIFTARMEHFITMPKWFVPYSISTNEILPKAKKDSTYLARNGYKVYSGRTSVGTKNIDWSKVKSGDLKIQQNAGGGNALGIVKFIFPNEYNVYIHDTPSKRYFSKDIRAYSHGCIRLQNPQEFADYLADTRCTDITRDSLDYRFENRIRDWIGLSEPLTVKIRYVTASGDTGGTLMVNKDIYGYDEKLINAWPRSLPLAPRT